MHIWSGWWWLEHLLFFHLVGNAIIPVDELIFFKGVGQPPTSYDPLLITINHYISLYIYIYIYIPLLITIKSDGYGRSTTNQESVLYLKLPDPRLKKNMRWRLWSDGWSKTLRGANEVLGMFGRPRNHGISWWFLWDSMEFTFRQWLTVCELKNCHWFFVSFRMKYWDFP